METACDPKRFEQKWYAFWLERNLFAARPRSRRPPFSIVIPPPNITGELHIGHALNNTLQDVLIRWRRMQGFDALWIPGTDHAGIATQMVVERWLAEQGKTRHDLGRDRFVEEIWRWRSRYGGRIIEQLKRLGVSCDWSRERFTLDAGLSRAVREVFTRLFREGLIYRGEYIVHWCPRCRTALSDLEVVHSEVAGRLYTLRYPLRDGSGFLRIATTRPETLLGDTAVAVHPDDPRYRGLVGREAVLPVLGRILPILADAFVDPKFGTGAIKVTPAHDPNDFEIGRRHGLPAVNVLDEQGRMNEAAGPYAGMDRLECRARILEQLRREDLLLDVQDHPHAVGHCQRCRTLVEPRLSRQWFLRVAPLVTPAVEAVEQGRIRFYPDSWKKTYFEWMRNIHDWCISRQLWWGHRIPAWYCAGEGHVVVAGRAPRRCPECGDRALRQDEDVLDTWFSSSLWPFSTLGWPRSTLDLKRYYPTSTLVTGYDIIFFWVARMIMMGLKLRGDVPFREVYFNGLVRDAHGEKMSKTRGNVIDPLEVIDTHGADAVRFTLAILAVPGTEIPLSPARMDGYRAFVNKIWNAARFVLMNLEAGPKPALPGPRLRQLEDRWILSRVNQVAREVDEALAAYRFDEAANRLYHLVWHEFCDWYVEFSKLPLSSGGADRRRAAATLLEVLDRILRLLHPFMPFVTEELWQKLPGRRGTIAARPFPRFRPAEVDEEAEASVGFLVDLITRVRNVRAEAKIEPGRPIRIVAKVGDPGRRRLIEAKEPLLRRLARAERIELVEEFAPGLVGARGVLGEAEFVIPLAGVLDREGERLRLEREKRRVDQELEATGRKLDNSAFLRNAPAHIVDKVRDEHRRLQEKRAWLEHSLAELRA